MSEKAPEPAPPKGRSPLHKDFWDKLRASGTVSMAAVISILGGVFTWVSKTQETSRQQAQLYAQILSAREQADANLRKEMFNQLMGSYMGPQTDDPEKRLTCLRLLALNFSDSFDARPLFEELHATLRARNLPDLQKQLKALVSEIAHRQLLEVGAATSELQDVTGEGEELVFRLAFGEVVRGLKVRVKGWDDSGLRLEIGGDTPADGKFFGTDRSNVEDRVSLYGLPLTDHVKLPGGSRLAFSMPMLDKELQAAKLGIVALKDDFISQRDRPQMSVLLKRLLVDRASLLPWSK